MPLMTDFGQMPAPAMPPAVSGEDDSPEYLAALKSGNLGNLFTVLEREKGLPAGFLAKTAKIESGGNPNAKNPNSSAEGVFQFINSTGRQYGLNSSEEKRDPVLSTLAAAELASDNRDYLKQRLGREPTAGELYVAHQQGAGGAAKLLLNPNAPAASIVGADAARLNGGANLSAWQLANRWASKLDGATPTINTSTGVGAMDPETTGSIGTGFSGGLMGKPYQAAEDNGSPLLQAIGMALLSGSRFNPLGTLPTILQAQAKDRQTAENQRYGRWNDDRNFTLRQQEAARAQGNTDRSFGMQEKQLALATEKANAPETRQLADGSTVRIDNDGKVTQVTPPIRQLNEVEKRRQDADTFGLTGEARNNYILNGKYEPAANGANPYANPGGVKTTGEQDKSSGFADRMFQNEGVIRQNEALGTSRFERGANAIPGVGSMITSDEFKKYDAAKQNWIAAQLRKESGAAIGAEEYAAADRQYFPQPGDPAAVIAQKRELRATATKGMARDGGPGYRPPMVFDDKGDLQPYGGTQRAPAATAGAQAKPPVEQRFQALIGGGMSKDEAYAKLRQEGY